MMQGTHSRWPAVLAIALALVGCNDDPGDRSVGPTPSDGETEAGSGGPDATEGEEPPAGEDPGGEAPPGEAGDGWLSFESADEGFRVDLPVEPVRDEQTIPSEAGPLRVVIFVAQVDDTAGYNVGYTDYPEAVLDVESDVLLDGAVRGAATNVSGTVESSTKLDVDGFPAVDYVITAGGADLQARAILVERRLYVLQRGGPQSDEEGFQRLVESFELVDA